MKTQSDIRIVRQAPDSLVLKHIVKYLWRIECEVPDELDRWLVPVCNCDLVARVSTPVRYTKCDGTETVMDCAHLCGPRLMGSRVRQKGPFRVLGASFYPAGAFALTKTPMGILTDRTIPLKELLPDLDRVLEAHLFETLPHNEFAVLEELLVWQVLYGSVPFSEEMSILSEFCRRDPKSGILKYCMENGIHPRRLERTFRRHIGLSPMEYRRLLRFQQTIRKLIEAPGTPLSHLAYDCGFSDQPHLNREFRRMLGVSPSAFRSKNRTVLELLRRD